MTYQWLQNGRPIPGARGRVYQQNGVTAADVGNYTLRITHSGGQTDVPGGTVTLSETFPAWVAAQGLASPHDTRAADPDGDGAGNDLEYLFGTDPRSPGSKPETSFYPVPTDPSGFGYIFDTFTFAVRAAATDCNWVMEHSRDLATWTDMRELAKHSTPDGTQRNYELWMYNENSGFLPEGVDASRSFLRVRMVRP